MAKRKKQKGYNLKNGQIIIKHGGKYRIRPGSPRDEVSSDKALMCRLSPDARGRIHSLLFRSSLQRSLKAALQLLCVQPPNTYIDWLAS